ncbi:MAG: thioredoxin family protein [Planctomycetaceae bacterium]
MQPLQSLFVTLIALLLLPATATAQQAGWFSDLQTARELAAQRNATLLVHVYGPQCPPCRRMDRDVFSVPQVQAALTRGIVAVKLNGDANPSIIRDLGVRSYPADVIFKPGAPIEVRHRSHSTTEYLALLDSIATHPPAPATQAPKAVAGNTGHPSVSAPSPSRNARRPSSPQQQSDSPPSAEEENILNSNLVGLDGFCPVTLHQRRIPRPGNPEFAAVHQGIRYYFASAELRNRFRADPSRYAPAIQGCDPITLTREQRAIPGSIRFGAWYLGRLYLFQSEANRRLFSASPGAWTKIQSAANPSGAARVRQ